MASHEAGRRMLSFLTNALFVPIEGPAADGQDVFQVCVVCGSFYVCVFGGPGPHIAQEPLV